MKFFRDLIQIKKIIQEISPILNLQAGDSVTHSTNFEDNKVALHLANYLKYHFITKHISIKYHHFRDWVKKGLVKIRAIHTNDQQADIFTKPLPLDKFQKSKKQIMGW